MNINLQIAERKGLTVSLFQDELCSNPIPNYTSDPKLILELVLELGLAGWKYEINNYLSHQWSKNGLAIVDKDFGLCTAMAWREMKGIDCE